jgi:hypothetical protein
VNWILKFNEIYMYLNSIQLHLMEFEFNSNSTKWNLQISFLKLNSIEKKWNLQIGGEGIENSLVNMVLKKNNNCEEIFKKNTFPCLFNWEWPKHIFVWIYPSDNYNLWLMQPKVVLSKWEFNLMVLYCYYLDV